MVLALCSHGPRTRVALSKRAAPLQLPVQVTTLRIRLQAIFGDGVYTAGREFNFLNRLFIYVKLEGHWARKYAQNPSTGQPF